LSPSKKIEAGLKGTERAMQCCYCDAVYTVDIHGYKAERGHFEGWGFDNAGAERGARGAG